MKIFLDLLPIILFFASYEWAGGHKELVAHWMSQHLGFAVAGGTVAVTEAPVMLATVVAVIGSVLQITVLKALRKPVDKMVWVTFAIVVVLGGLTLWFHDETFIKWKPTVIHWVMAVGFFVTEIMLERKMLAQMMGGQVDAPDAVWRQLGWAWVLFCFLMGVLNLWVAYHYDTDTWVKFKMWGTTAITFVFMVAQGLYLGRHIKPEETSKAS